MQKNVDGENRAVLNIIADLPANRAVGREEFVTYDE